MNDYDRFVATQRYHREVARPWQFGALAGLGAVAIVAHGIFTSPFTPTAEMFLNRYFGGLLLATIAAFVGGVTESTGRWLPAVMTVSLAPVAWVLLSTYVPHIGVQGTKDHVLAILIASLVFVSIYLLLRPQPRLPS